MDHDDLNNSMRRDFWGKQPEITLNDIIRPNEKIIKLVEDFGPHPPSTPKPQPPPKRPVLSTPTAPFLPDFTLNIAKIGLALIVVGMEQQNTAFVYFAAILLLADTAAANRAAAVFVGIFAVFSSRGVVAVFAVTALFCQILAMLASIGRHAEELFYD